MSRTPTEREIDGVLFEVTPLGFREAKSLLVRLSKALGPALAELADGAGPTRIAPALGAMIEGLSEADLDHAIKVLGEVTRYSTDGGRKRPYLTGENVDQIFGGGRMLLLFKWLVFALEVQFGDFFAVLGPRPGAGPDRATTAP